MRATLDACCAKNWSVGQCGTWHKADPSVSLKVPAAHAVHVSPFAPEKPALHSHMELFGLATGENELAGHDWHMPAPLLYMPATHTQNSTDGLAGGEMVFGGQVAHPMTGLTVAVSSLFSASEAPVKSLSERW